MRTRHFVYGGLLLLGVCGTAYLRAQDPSDEVRTTTMRPVIRGRPHAAASMKPEATRAAERILEAGGNAFDAAVAGQAVLGIVDAASNGIGSDAVILVYDAAAEAVVSINAEGTAPQLATIEWYQKNQRRRSSRRATGCSRERCPAWSTPGTSLLDRWGTMTFAQVLQPAIDIGRERLPDRRADGPCDRRVAQDQEVPDQREGLLPRTAVPPSRATSSGTPIWRARCGSWSRRKRSTPARGVTKP